MNKDHKTLVKNSLLFSIAPFLPKVVNVALLPIMTLYLTDVDFGIAGTISSYTSAISAFATLGLTVVLQNTFYKTPLVYKDVWRKIYGFLKMWMWVYAALQALLLYFCVPEEASHNRLWIILLTNFSTVFFGPTSTIGSSYYIYSKQSWPVVWRSFLASIITIVVDFVLIVYLRLGYMGWYIGSFAGIFFSNVTYWYPVTHELGLKPIYRFDLTEMRHALSVGIPTIPHYYTGYLLEGSGRMVMDQCNVAQGEIGKISISQQIGGLFNQASIGLSNAFSPYVMNGIKNNNEIVVRKICYLYTSAVFLSAFLLSIWSKEIFSILLSNESLSSSYKYFILFIMALCYRPMYVIASFYYFYYEKTKQLLKVTFVAGLIAIISYSILTPFIGVWAFLYGHYVSCLYFGYAGYLYKTYMDNAKSNIPWLFILIVQIVLTIIAYYVVDLFFPKVIISFLLLLVIIIIIYTYRNVIKK